MATERKIEKQSSKPMPETAPVVPVTVADIPGLGPIRVRAFQKAGINSALQMWELSIESLELIPGITPNKARYIHDYVHAFEQTDIVEASAQAERAQAATVADAARSSRATNADWLEVPVSPFALEAARVLGSAVIFLAANHATDLRQKLLTASQRLAAECQAAISEGAVPDTDQEKILRRLRRTADTLNTAVTMEADRKEQGRLADELIDTAELIQGFRNAFADRLTARRRGSS